MLALNVWIAVTAPHYSWCVDFVCSFVPVTLTLDTKLSLDADAIIIKGQPDTDIGKA
jgi:hypothetical protein